MIKWLTAVVGLLLLSLSVSIAAPSADVTGCKRLDASDLSIAVADDEEAVVYRIERLDRSYGIGCWFWHGFGRAAEIYCHSCDSHAQSLANIGFDVAKPDDFFLAPEQRKSKLTDSARAFVAEYILARTFREPFNIESVIEPMPFQMGPFSGHLMRFALRGERFQNRDFVFGRARDRCATAFLAVTTYDYRGNPATCGYSAPVGRLHGSACAASAVGKQREMDP